jgi:deoxyribodipyrimidine photo-lyase
LSEARALVWFGSDLRLADNPALTAASERRFAILPVFIYAPDEESPWPPGAASRWWLHQSLLELAAALVKRGARLIIRRGPAAEALLKLAEESGARSVFWNRRYESAAIARDAAIERRLRERGVTPEIFSGNVLFEPGAVLNAKERPFQVFTAFWRACLAMPDPPEPTPAPKKIPAPGKWPSR